MVSTKRDLSVMIANVMLMVVLLRDVATMVNVLANLALEEQSVN